MSRGGDVRLGLKLEQVLVGVALLVLGRGASATVNRLAASRVERALHWFEENLGENPTVDDVACAVGVSAAHLRRIFAAEGGRSPRAELARLRMAAAQRCLREGWKQDRVARFLGFSDASAFSRSFSAECGLSPRRWLSGGEGGIPKRISFNLVTRDDQFKIGRAAMPARPASSFRTKAFTSM